MQLLSKVFSVKMVYRQLITIILSIYKNFSLQPDLMRFRFLLPKDILPRLRDLALARKELPEGEMLLPDVHGFMTQDEIDAVLTQSAPIAGAASRIYQFFQHLTAPMKNWNF